MKRTVTLGLGIIMAALILNTAPAIAGEWIALNRQTIELYNAGRYAEAISIAERAVAAAEREYGPQDAIVELPLNNLAGLYKAQGRYSEAEPLYRRALGIAEKVFGPEDPDVATSLNNLALLYQAQGRYNEAESLFQRALGIRERALGPEHPNVAASLINLAILYIDIGRCSEAESLSRRALEIIEWVREHPPAARPLSDLELERARLMGIVDRYTTSETVTITYGEARSPALGPEHQNMAVCLMSLAIVYYAQDRYSEAEPLCRRALEIFERVSGPEHPSVACSLNILAVLYSDQGRYSEAESLYRRALGIFEKALGPEHTAVAGSLNNLAVVYVGQGRYSEAEPLCRRTLEIFERVLGPEHPHLATPLTVLAYLFQANGDTPAAVGQFARAIEASRTTRAAWDGTAYTLRPLPGTVDCLWSYSIAQASDTGVSRPEALNNALKTARAALELFARMRGTMEQGSRQFHEQKFSNLPGWVLYLQSELEKLGEAPDPELSLQAVEMGAAWTMLDLLAQARIDVAGSLPDTVAREEYAIRSHIKWLDDHAGDTAADAERLAMERTYDSFIGRLYRDHPRYAALRYPRPADLATVRQALGPDEAAVAYLVSGWGCYAVVVTDDTIAFRYLGTEKELTSRLDPLVRGLNDPASLDSTDTEPLRELYQLLAAPVARMVAGKRLFIVPSGPLERLSFEMLVTPDRKYWSEAQALQYIPSLAILALQREWQRRDPARAERLLAVADPVYPQTEAGMDQSARGRASNYSDTTREAFWPLPGTAVEAEAVAQNFPAGDSLVLLGLDASEARVRGEDWHQYGYFHFACHGTLEAGREPALVLSLTGNEPPADGFLLLSEVIGKPHRAHLTVLSACNSGRGGAVAERMGVSSLARAFLLAGSDGVIASLWGIDDDATAALMGEIYRQMKEEGLAPAAALRAAQVTLRNTPGHPTWRHPFFWAPFVYIGP